MAMRALDRFPNDYALLIAPIALPKGVDGLRQPPHAGFEPWLLGRRQEGLGLQRPAPSKTNGS